MVVVIVIILVTVGHIHALLEFGLASETAGYKKSVLFRPEKLIGGSLEHC